MAAHRHVLRGLAHHDRDRRIQPQALLRKEMNLKPRTLIKNLKSCYDVLGDLAHHNRDGRIQPQALLRK